MRYIEIAQDSPRNRGVLIPIQSLGKYIDNVGTPLYRSSYIYDEEAVEYVEKNNSLASYYGPRSIDNILIDIDKKDNSDLYTLDKARSIIMDLEDLGVSRHSIRPYFSGTGYHILLSNELFEFTTSQDLPYLVKGTIKEIFPLADHSVLIRTAIYRVAHTKNQKTGLYKIPLTMKELMHSSAEEIQYLAKGPRFDFGYSELVGEGELIQYVVNTPSKTTTFNNVREPNTIVPCVQEMIKLGPQEGCRNNTSMRIISLYRRSGLPSIAAKAGLLSWFNGQVEEKKVVETVERVYNKGYQYGCNDEIMSKHCKTRCVHFKRKDLTIDIESTDDLQKKFADRLATDFSGRTINVGKMLGMPVDSEIYPGELVTVIGRTGSNKSTFVQNLALGVDFANDSINPEWQIPTLFLSLELADWYMHRRGMQIVSGLSKEEVTNNHQEVYSKHKDDLGHIKFQTVAPTIQQIQNKIKELQPALVIVDYIDLVDTGRNGRSEHEKIKYISHNLSNIAVNMDLIIIQVSQVGREHSQNNDLTLYSAKGSGAIENASRKVISVDGQANNPVKTIRMLKNTDGDSNWECDVEWQESFRLRRVYE
jgi:hypothetical protein